MVCAMPHSGGEELWDMCSVLAPRTALELRREIQHSQESLIALPKHYGVNPKAVEKLRKRDFVHDVPTSRRLLAPQV